VEIFDWNQIEQAKSLGVATINVIDIEPFQSEERVLNLVSTKHGEKGQIRVRLLFRPMIIAKSRKNTSTFSSAGRAMTQIGGLPVSAGKGVFHGVTGLIKRGDRDREETVSIPDVPAGQASQPIGAEAMTAKFPSSDGAQPSSQEPGSLRVMVIGAKDLSQTDCKPYATIRVGDKEFKTKHTHKTSSPEWNESFVFAASPLTQKIYVWVHDHKTLGKDKTIGEGEVDIWRHIQPRGMTSAEVLSELREGGQLRLRLEFDSSTNPVSSSSSVSSSEHISRTMSIVNPSRFSIRGRRPGAENDED
jgi:Ca2+-dependent lipid-binding protein